MNWDADLVGCVTVARAAGSYGFSVARAVSRRTLPRLSKLDRERVLEGRAAALST